MMNKTFALVIQEFNDKYRLWDVYNYTVNFSREVDFIPIMGNQEKFKEYLGMFLVIKRTNLVTM